MSRPAPSRASAPSIGWWVLLVAVGLSILGMAMLTLLRIEGEYPNLWNAAHQLWGGLWHMVPLVLGGGIGALAAAFVGGARSRRWSLVGVGVCVAVKTVLAMAAIIPHFMGVDLPGLLWSSHWLMVLVVHATLLAWAVATLAAPLRGKPAELGLSWAMVGTALAPSTALLVGAAEWVLYRVGTGSSLAEVIGTSSISALQLLVGFIVMCGVAFLGQRLRSMTLWPTLVLGVPAVVFLFLELPVPERVHEVVGPWLWAGVGGTLNGGLAGALIAEGWPGLRPTPEEARVTAARQDGS